MTGQRMNSKKPQSLLPLLVMIGGTLLLVAALAIGLGGGKKIEPTPTVQLTSNDQVQRIGAQEAKVAYDNGSAVFVDVRSAEAYSELHITGAVNIPLGEIENRMGELNPDDWIITY